MTTPILNLDQIVLHPLPAEFAATGKAAERYAPRIGLVGAQLGAQKLGYNLIALAPGMRAFPFHSHRVNEEMFFIVAGVGEIRIGEQRYPLRSGDIVACPAGDASTAHQIINTGENELRYLALSTQMSPEVVEFPDSGKYSVQVDHTVDANGQSKGFRTVGKLGEALDYWDGE
jgi:uncharacterized cupin superfamily protein